jgi:hypothetical protein
MALTASSCLEVSDVKRVIEEGDRLDLEVEPWRAHAGCCPGCGRASLDIKDQ